MFEKDICFMLEKKVEVLGWMRFEECVVCFIWDIGDMEFGILVYVGCKWFIMELFLINFCLYEKLNFLIMNFKKIWVYILGKVFRKKFVW